MNIQEYYQVEFLTIFDPKIVRVHTTRHFTNTEEGLEEAWKVADLINAQPDITEAWVSEVAVRVFRVDKAGVMVLPEPVTEVPESVYNNTLDVRSILAGKLDGALAKYAEDNGLTKTEVVDLAVQLLQVKADVQPTE